MKQKIIIVFLLVCLLAGGGYFYYYFTQQKTEVASLNTKLQQAQESLDKDKNDQAALEQSYKKQIEDATAANEQAHDKVTFTSSIMSKNKYDFKVVKLSSGAIYYGVVTAYSAGVITLTDIYYLQGFVDFDATGGNGQSLSLVKKGAEADANSGDTLLINDGTVTSISTLSTDSRVYKAIELYETTPHGQ